MTTVVNNPSPEHDSGGSSFLFGIILLLGVVLVGVFFGIPLLKRMGPIQVQLPETKVIIPEKIDVNVTQQK